MNLDHVEYKTWVEEIVLCVTVPQRVVEDGPSPEGRPPFVIWELPEA